MIRLTLSHLLLGTIARVVARKSPSLQESHDVLGADIAAAKADQELLKKDHVILKDNHTELNASLAAMGSELIGVQNDIATLQAQQQV